MDPNKFMFQKENGEQIECEMIFSFYIKEADRNYMLFTDNTYDDDNNLKIYVYQMMKHYYQ